MKAVELSRSLVEEDPEDRFYSHLLAVSLKNHGIRLTRTKDLENAESPLLESCSLLKQLSNNEPENMLKRDAYADSLDSLGVLYEKMEQWDEAIENYRLALATTTRVEYLIDTNERLRMLKTKLGRSHEPVARVVNLAKEATERYPEIGSHWSNLGLALYRVGEWEEAAKSLEKADGMIDGGDLAHRMFLAMACWHLGEKDRARKLYSQAAAWIEAHQKTNVQHQRWRGETEQLLGLSEQDRSELITRYYIEVEPNDAESFMDRGHWYRSQGMNRQAIVDFSEAIRLEPESTDGGRWRSRGISYERLLENEKALSDLCKAIELNANDWWAKTVRGNVYLRLDQLEPALADLTTAIELKPTFHRYLLRAKVLRKRNEFESALADCDRAIEIGPDNDSDDNRRAEAHACRGAIYVENLGEFEKGEVEYAKAVDLAPGEFELCRKASRGSRIHERG